MQFQDVFFVASGSATAVAASFRSPAVATIECTRTQPVHRSGSCIPGSSISTPRKLPTVQPRHTFSVGDTSWLTISAAKRGFRKTKRRTESGQMERLFEKMSTVEEFLATIAETMATKEELATLATKEELATVSKNVAETRKNVAETRKNVAETRQCMGLLAEGVVRQEAKKKLGKGAESAKIQSLANIVHIFPEGLQDELLAAMLCDIDDPQLDHLLFKQLAKMLLKQGCPNFLKLIEQEMGADFLLSAIIKYDQPNLKWKVEKDTDEVLGNLLQAWCLKVDDDENLKEMFSRPKAGGESREVFSIALGIVSNFKKFISQGRDRTVLHQLGSLAICLTNLRVNGQWVDHIEVDCRGCVESMDGKLVANIGEIKLFPTASSLKYGKKQLRKLAKLILWAADMLQSERKIEIVGRLYIAGRGSQTEPDELDLASFNETVPLKESFNGKEVKGELTYVLHESLPGISSGSGLEEEIDTDEDSTDENSPSSS